MMNARLMEAEQGLGGCWMMNGRQIGRSSHTLELEELGGFVAAVGLGCATCSHMSIALYPQLLAQAKGAILAIYGNV